MQLWNNTITIATASMKEKKNNENRERQRVSMHTITHIHTNTPTSPSQRAHKWNEKQRKKYIWLNIVFICWWKERKRKRLRARQRFICNIHCVWSDVVSCHCSWKWPMGSGMRANGVSMWVRRRSEANAMGNHEIVKRPRTEWNTSKSCEFDCKPGRIASTEKQTRRERANESDNKRTFKHIYYKVVEIIIVAGR